LRAGSATPTGAGFSRRNPKTNGGFSRVKGTFYASVSTFGAFTFSASTAKSNTSAMVRT
jgi:hypothetical protein